MPLNSKVHHCYEDVRKQGHSEESAARICEHSTGENLRTGKPPKKSVKVLRVKYRRSK